MTIDADIYTRLSGYAGLTALVSTRIEPVILKQGETFPAVVFTPISGFKDNVMGPSTALHNTRFQFDIYSQTHTDLGAIETQIRDAIQFYSASDTVFIDAVFPEGDVRDDYDDDLELYNRSFDLIFHWRNL